MDKPPMPPLRCFEPLAEDEHDVNRSANCLLPKDHAGEHDMRPDAEREETHHATPPTAVVQIGNSDDKLTQAQWYDFFTATERVVSRYGGQIHFAGASMPISIWQNACWVFEIDADRVANLKANLGFLAKDFRQDSIAFTMGGTLFVPAAT